MALTLQQIFGASATQTGTKITIDTVDFSGTGLNGANPSPTQILCAFLKRLDTSLEPFINDPSVGVSPPSFRQDSSLTTRGDQRQIAYPIQLNFYTTSPISALDPDNVI